ncbi:BldC family transcriptional regulator [Nocardiopsis quinghaiensis]|uniref:BldC family transcriptional regulator n=1 Tax=Nocardiopsis quinghaiensis TaxID=464995 RepID=UPI001238D0CD|nr:BldC family transcriptional regulator [Nocardiopsis quinghaiensis]
MTSGTTAFPATDTESEAPLTPAEVATLFRVDSKTVARWAARGLLSSFRTPGGHRRFLAREVYSLLARDFTLAGGS